MSVHVSSSGAVHTGAMSQSIYIRLCVTARGNSSIAINLLRVFNCPFFCETGT